jgi:phosphoglycerate dehydrogenase-like enzyme
VIAPALDAVRARAPEGVEVLELDGDLDLETVDFLVPSSEAPDVLERLPALSRVAVVQVLSAGTDWIESRVPPQAILCSARGARDAPVAEWVVGALLGATTQLLECARLDTWRRRSLSDLGGWTVVIVGMGSIGRRVEQHLAGFGTRVIGVASHARDDVHGTDELDALLPGADAVVLLTPLTDATRGLIDAPRLAAMRDGTVLINAARGPVVDTDALVAEVTTGRLHAVLDVTDPEPLPDGHPLWQLENCIITPHTADTTEMIVPLLARRIEDNVSRFAAGEPLAGVVDPSLGY